MEDQTALLYGRPHSIPRRGILALFFSQRSQDIASIYEIPCVDLAQNNRETSELSILMTFTQTWRILRPTIHMPPPRSA